MTKTYNLESDDDLWLDWKRTVPRTYPRLNDRIQELLAADVAAHDAHRKGVVELLIDEGLVEEEDVRSLLDGDDQEDA